MLRCFINTWRSNDLDLHGGWGEGSDFLLHTVTNSWVHGGSSGKDGIGVKILSDINITLHDGVVGRLVDSRDLHSCGKRVSTDSTRCKIGGKLDDVLLALR